MNRILGYAAPAILLTGVLATAGCAAGTSTRAVANVSVARPARPCLPGVNAAEYWMMDPGQFSDLKTSHPAAVRYGIKPANAFVLSDKSKVYPAQQSVAYFKSYAAFTTAITRHTIARGTRWVAYDNEVWTPTPVKEQKKPLYYEKLFADLAHRHGYKVILTPAQNLVGTWKKGTVVWPKYLSEGFARVSGQLADIYEIQAQSYEQQQYRGGANYLRFIKAAAAQAHAANPRVKVFAGLSTQRVTTTAQMDQDFLATRGPVSGYWLNIPKPAPAGLALAAQFLRELPAPASATGRSCPLG